MTSASETIPNANGGTNPYRDDGRDGVRYDTATGVYWMRVRAYDSTVGRFLARDPLGWAPLCFADQPYAVWFRAAGLSWRRVALELIRVYCNGNRR